MQKKENLKAIHSRRVAIALRQKGFSIIKTEVNKKNPQHDVYFFQNTPLLIESLLEVTQR